MFEFLMRHNPVRVMFDKDSGDGNGQGGSNPTDGAKPAANGQGSDPTRTDGGDELPKTKEELEKVLQSEADKRVSQALRKAREENQKAIDDAVRDALENEKMTQKEREDKARKKELETIEQGKREIAEGKRQLLIVDKMAELKVPDVVMAMRNSITSQEEDGIVSEIKGLVGIYEAGKSAAKQEVLATRGADIPGKSTPGDSPDAGIQAEYNALMAKPQLSNVEQRRLSELAVKIKAMKSK